MRVKMLFQDLFTIFFTWLFENIIPLIVSAVTILIGYIIYIAIKKQLKNLEEKEKLSENTSRSLTKALKYLIGLIIASAIFFQFAESLGLITALFSLVGGTILGFATMNTLGNAIAGLIIMVSRPFSVGDRLIYNDKIVDVDDIKLIFTIMIDLDGIKISVPNQKLLTNDIVDLGKKEVVRRQITITPSFEEDRHKVESVLLEAVKDVPGVLNEPEPYVWITNFQNYAVEYSLFVFIKELKRLPFIESELHKKILDACKDSNIDIRTPTLIQQLNN